MKRWPLLALLAGTAWMAGPALAQALRDPTQPPAVLTPVAPGATVEPVSSEPQLQSVLISQRANGRRVAVIDGQTVRVGDTFRDFKVVKISLTEVTLRQGKVESKLVMAPPSTARPQAASTEEAKKGPARPDAAKAAVAPLVEPFNASAR